ncbi:MAG: tRNA epoxyqueuosine(34) reductase QueG [Prevotellaceae bacterium]|nr:tRNA epoxyqueuosine(34) reductase QueG [Prevotellaceae bacterium]
MSKSFTFLLKQRALDLGFDACGVAKAEALPLETERLRAWIVAGAHAGMDYMSRNMEKRENPQLLLAGAKSVIVLMMNYNPPVVQKGQLPQIAYYAYGKDYHDVIGEKLKIIERFIHAAYPTAQTRGFVDSAPLFEKAWAIRAGLGWIGKNNLLISRELGSFNLLSVILTDIVVEYDDPEQKNYCADCTKCLKACPSGALCQPYFLDARKCIAYQTIEKKQPVEVDTHGYLFGCDICQKVCPWNAHVYTHTNAELAALPEIMTYTRTDWLALEEEQFNRIFAHSPLQRVGLTKLKQIVNSTLITQI